MSMTMVDFATAAETGNFHTQLTALANEDLDYMWLKPILTETLDQFVHTKLSRQPPDLRAFDPCQLEENLSEANRLLDICLAQRNDIHSLEAEAVVTALDLSLAEHVQPLDTELARTYLQAARALANEQPATLVPPPHESAIGKKDRLLNQARHVRLHLHNAPGGALNFGERVSFRRGIYAENVRTIYERLHAVRLGAAAYFGVMCRPVPAWAEVGNSMEKLVNWARSSMEMLEKGDRFETVSERMFLVGQHGLMPAHDVYSALRNEGDCGLSFELTQAQFKDVNLSTHVIRVLAAGIAPTFDENDQHFVNISTEITNSSHDPLDNSGGKKATLYQFISDYQRMQRERFSFSAWIDLPAQSTPDTTIPQHERDWYRERVFFSGLAPWIGGRVRDAVDLVSDTQIANTTPFGTWRVTIPAEVLDTHRLRNRKSPGLNGQLDTNMILHEPKDVLIALRVAVRRKYQAPPTVATALVESL